jgi:hypothetical protein
MTITADRSTSIKDNGRHYNLTQQTQTIVENRTSCRGPKQRSAQARDPILLKRLQLQLVPPRRTTMVHSANRSGCRVMILDALYFFGGMQDTEDLSLAIAESKVGTVPLFVKPTKAKLRKHPQFINESWTVMQRIEAEQTGRVFASRPTLAPQRETHFMEFHSGVSKAEAYSGSWLQRTQKFKTMQIDAMENGKMRQCVPITTNPMIIDTAVAQHDRGDETNIWRSWSQRRTKTFFDV